MNKRQAKKKRKIEDIRLDYGGLPIRQIKEFNRAYDDFFNSPIGRKEKVKLYRKFNF